MQLSHTTNQNGLVQRVERYTRRPYGSTGDELREIITDLNESFADIMPLLLSYADQIRWDDSNNTDAPIGYTNLVANQEDYKITVDDNSLDILNLLKVRILTSSSGTVYQELERMLLDDPRVAEAMSPSSTSSGVPTHFLENGPFIWLYPAPSYSATNGMELFFQRQQTYFTVTGTSGDDTTEPGIPLIFHELLALIAAMKWNVVNRTDDSNLIGILSRDIERKKQEIRDFINFRNPSRQRMTTSYQSSIGTQSGRLGMGGGDSNR